MPLRLPLRRRTLPVWQRNGLFVLVVGLIVDLTDVYGAGLSNARIGHRLHIGETTVKTHVSRVLAELDLWSSVQAAILAQESGLASN